MKVGMVLPESGQQATRENIFQANLGITKHIAAEF
jgi:hypothetical protein